MEAWREELYHHGILGMHWGVRRYQNRDGSLTEKGKKRLRKVENSKIRSKHNTKVAKNILKRHVKQLDKTAKRYEKNAIKKNDQANHYIKGSEPYDKYMKKSKEYSSKVEDYLKIKDMASKKLSDIDSEKLKAGRDFIIQTDLNFNLTTFGSAKERYNNSVKDGEYNYNGASYYIPRTGMTINKQIIYKKK